MHIAQYDCSITEMGEFTEFQKHAEKNSIISTLREGDQNNRKLTLFTSHNQVEQYSWVSIAMGIGCNAHNNLFSIVV